MLENKYFEKTAVLLSDLRRSEDILVPETFKQSLRADLIEKAGLISRKSAWEALWGWRPEAKLYAGLLGVVCTVVLVINLWPRLELGGGAQGEISIASKEVMEKDVLNQIVEPQSLAMPAPSVLFESENTADYYINPQLEMFAPMIATPPKYLFGRENWAYVTDSLEESVLAEIDGLVEAGTVVSQRIRLVEVTPMVNNFKLRLFDEQNRLLAVYVLTRREERLQIVLEVIY